MNYFHPEKLEQQEKLLYSSVLDFDNNQKNLWKKDNKINNKIEEKSKIENQREKIREKIEKRNIITITKNKKFHSIDKLVVKKSEENLDIPVDIVPFENRIVIPRI
jgi:hypothetical protein